MAYNFLLKYYFLPFNFFRANHQENELQNFRAVCNRSWNLRTRTKSFGLVVKLIVDWHTAILYYIIAFAFMRIAIS